MENTKDGKYDYVAIQVTSRHVASKYEYFGIQVTPMYVIIY